MTKRLYKYFIIIFIIFNSFCFNKKPDFDNLQDPNNLITLLSLILYSQINTNAEESGDQNTATLLLDENVLVTGGYSGSNAHLYDIENNTYTSIGSMQGKLFNFRCSVL